MTPARGFALAVVVGVLLVLAGLSVADGQPGTDDYRAASQSSVPAPVAHSRFVTAVEGWRDARREVRSLRRSLAYSPDAEMSLQIAGIVYGQDWRAMRRCWLSEGYRNAERRERRIVRLNNQGSGASGPAQFMPGTWRSTPFGRLDIFNVQAQAFATGWMLSQGRKREWAGVGCR